MLPKRKRLVIIGLAVGVTAAVISALVLVPVPQHFTMHGAAIYDPNTSCAVGYSNTIDTTIGTSVNFHWSAPSWITFFAVKCNSIYDVPYVGNGSSGSGTFISEGGVYQFGASCPEGACVAADVSGSYTGPVLPL
jgi:hypothetical protein